MEKNRFAFKLILCSIWLLVGMERHAGAQETYNCINYHWEQGFNADMGYAIHQDKKGYIWIGTENGLFRYNGRDFKQYTAQNGLPNNDILGITEDAKERLWLFPFASAVYYMRQDSFYTAENTQALKWLKLKFRATGILFDRYRNTWICEEVHKLYRQDSGGNVEEISHVKIDGKNELIRFPSINQDNELRIMAANKILIWRSNGFVPVNTVPFNYMSVSCMGNNFIIDAKHGRFICNNTSYPFPQKNVIRRFPGFSNSMFQYHVVISEHEVVLIFEKGANILNLCTGEISKTFLPDCVIGGCIKAKDGALWFSTLGKGIFQFVRSPVRTINVPQPMGSIIYTKGLVDGVLAANTEASLTEFKISKNDYEDVKKSTFDHGNKNTRIKCIVQNKKKTWIGFSNNSLLIKKTAGKWTTKKNELLIVKSALEETDTTVLLGCVYGLFRFNIERLKITDTIIWGTRILSLARLADTIYAGTLNGLIACYPNKDAHHLLSDNQLLNGNINALCPGNNDRLWAASSGTLTGIKNGNIVGLLSFKEGLQCNRVSCLKAWGKYLWVGTDNGVFAVSQTHPYKIVGHIGRTAGLTNNQVNYIDVAGNRIWIGTTTGINYFDADEKDVFQDIDSTSIIINSITNGPRILQPSFSTIHLTNETLAIDFDVIDFRGGYKPVFEYKIGESGIWTNLDVTHLFFPVTPYGKFTLHIRAFAPNWVSAVTFKQDFYNPTPFYMSWWFITSVMVLSILIILLCGYLITRKVLAKNREKLAVEQNLLLLEQMALQGQMNPHFIFNCIAAIKQYYSSGDMNKAEDFVDAFSLLIRQTFEMANHVFVPLNKEIDYITQYLRVEQARFNNSFNYQINCSVITSDNRIPVPAMLLQPILENAIRHGIRHSSIGTGVIEITIKEDGERISFIIADNGIGLQKSRELKAQTTFQPLTSSIVNTRRINILNKLFKEKISIKTEEISKLKNGSGGTEVTISYSVNISELS